MSPLDVSSCCEFVGRSPLLAEVPREPMERALQALRLLEFAPGAEVIAESVAASASDDTALYVLVEGQLRATRAIGADRREALSTIQPGEFFGELVLAGDGRRTATVTAVTPAVVAQLPGSATERLIQDAPVVMRTIAASIARRLRAADDARIAARINEERLSIIGKAAAMLVHDLRNPLNVVNNAAALIEDHVGDPVHWAARSRSAAAFMLAMVQDLLDFAKGDRVFARAPMRLSSVIEDVDTFGLTPLEAAGKVLVARAISGDVAMIGDRRALSRALLNIVKNAAEAMPSGGTLTFESEVRDNEIILRVTDTGPGIPEHVLPTLFEPFSTHGKAGGTGLGMAMTKAAIDGHNGRISVETHAGTGTTFTIVLPVASRAPG